MDLINITLIIGIIILGIFVWLAYKIGRQKGSYEKEIEWQSQMNKIRRDIAERQRVNIKGKVSEVFAPFLEGFPYKASECKFLGDPIDYIVFEGLDERDIKAIHFVEVKSGKSKLNDVQKQIKNLLNDINSDKVSFKRFDFKDD
ncbi:hypothetical protein J4205_01470 [Candidatus Pacearchaeota archaeon]|nr:hypothetical protein [Candidatus Pacearchaeota archaeon]